MRAPHRTRPAPPCTALPLQVLGAKRRTLAGFSSTTAQPHQGFIFSCPIMATTPPPLKNKAVRLIAAKSTLLARKDAYGEDPSVSEAPGRRVCSSGARRDGGDGDGEGDREEDRGGEL